MREDRLVLPIPPHLHWSDKMPLLRPHARPASPAPALPAASQPGRVPEPVVGSKCAPQEPTPAPKARVQFAPPAPEPIAQSEPTRETPTPRENPRCDPNLIAAARELRDRYLEQVNTDDALLLPAAKYELTRALPTAPTMQPKPLPAAA